MKNILIALVSLSLLSSCVSCEASDRVLADAGRLNVMSYNAENLFDIFDNPQKNDDEFTPNGERRWTSRRYWNKLANLSRVVVAVDEDNAPEIIGLCEVENDSVLNDLTNRSPLRTIGYSYVITDSPDERGINVALLYKARMFRYIAHESIRVSLKPAGGSPTRDILHVTGMVSSGDTVDLYVCHWPSRIGGVEESEPRRRIVASALRTSVNDVLGARVSPFIVIMGDLNEGFAGPSVRETLYAHPLAEADGLPDSALVTLMDNVAQGSYKYEGAWDMYDQFVVSAGFLNGNSTLRALDARVCKLDFVLEDDDKYGGDKPYRTYDGYRYQDGFSDHLPVALDILMW